MKQNQKDSLQTGEPPGLTGIRRIYLLFKRLMDHATAIVLLALCLPVSFLFGRPARRLRKLAFRLIFCQRTLVGPSEAVANLPRGVVSEFRLWQLMDIEEDRLRCDRRYLETMGPVRDLALLARGVWVFLMVGPDVRPTNAQYFNLFDVVVNNTDVESIIGTLKDIVRSHPEHINKLLGQDSGDREALQPTPPAHVCFVNANNFNLAIERKEYMKVLREADLVLPDGIGVKLALRIAGGHLRRNLNGTDLLPHIATLLESEEWPLFLLGADKETLARAADNLRQKHPKLSIAGSHDGFFALSDETALCERINASGAMALIIGMGTPRQELFAQRNLHRLSVPLILSMGGLLDFLGGKNKRAPAWMRQAGLEWVYRIVQEPGRMWRRYVVGNPLFLYRAARWVHR